MEGRRHVALRLSLSRPLTSNISSVHAHAHAALKRKEVERAELVARIQAALQARLASELASEREMSVFR